MKTMPILKNIRKNLKELKKFGIREYVFLGIIAVWTLLFYEGRLIPGAKWLIEVVPLWVVVLNLILLFIFTTLFVNRTKLLPIGGRATLLCNIITWLFWSLFLGRFTLISAIGGGITILFNWGVKIWRTKKGQVAT
ncbi:MAG: hypothetical protein L0Z48_09280 [candidate division Zixibacteria bacterium]|nr:hypothetical protein [candidate division Zixibacteria bacterium]MCI0596713.1 hypothetical protein [candidate division Zixibacteria bacterium]